MAIIPQITPRVRQQAAPRPVFQSSAAATPDAFGASIGRGLQVAAQGASSFGDAMQRIKVQEQETELKTLDVEFSNRVRTLMYGDPIEETTGYLSTQNRDAIGGHVPLRDAIMKAREELISSAESDNVKKTVSQLLLIGGLTRPLPRLRSTPIQPAERKLLLFPRPVQLTR